ncbi:MAG: hypothetical protein KJ626_15540 [Verrucomicrobia bacterium]|nr:hypothetical protein [Verrucomicrobiota bacterium]
MSGTINRRGGQLGTVRCNPPVFGTRRELATDRVLWGGLFLVLLLSSTSSFARGKSDLCCYDPAQAKWYSFTTAGGFWSTVYGGPGMDPIVGDFDGDGRDDIGVYYPPGGEWSVFMSSEGIWKTVFGYAGTVPVVGDFDGDGLDDIGCYYAPGGNWYVFTSSEGFWETQFGYDGTVPLVGDFDVGQLVPHTYTGMPWQVISIENENITLFEDSYDAAFGHLTVELFNINDRLAFAIPDVPAGDYTLLTYINHNYYPVYFTVVSDPSIPDPQFYVNMLVSNVEDWVLGVLDELDQLALDMPDIFGSGGFSAFRSDIVNKLANLRTDIGTMTPSEIAEMARYLQANYDALGLDDAGGGGATGGATTTYPEDELAALPAKLMDYANKMLYGFEISFSFLEGYVFEKIAVGSAQWAASMKLLGDDLFVRPRAIHLMLNGMKLIHETPYIQTGDLVRHFGDGQDEEEFFSGIMRECEITSDYRNLTLWDQNDPAFTHVVIAMDTFCDSYIDWTKDPIVALIDLVNPSIFQKQLEFPSTEKTWHVPVKPSCVKELQIDAGTIVPAGETVGATFSHAGDGFFRTTLANEDVTCIGDLYYQNGAVSESWTECGFTVHPVLKVEITSPMDDDAFYPGETINFDGYALDENNNSVTDIEWRSDIDGLLSTATSFSRDNLSAGETWWVQGILIYVHPYVPSRTDLNYFNVHVWDAAGNEDWDNNSYDTGYRYP